MTLIFKIVHADEWARVGDVYAGSEKDRADGFLHFSTAEQLMGTLARYYADAHDLLLVAVDAQSLGNALKWEPSRDGDLFPHLYAALPRATVKWARPISRNTNSEFGLPELAKVR